MKKLAEFIHLLHYSLSLIFSSAPLLSAFFVLLVIVQGLIPSLSVLIGMALGNTIGQGSYQYTLFLTIAWVLTFTLPGILSPIVSMIQSILNQKATFLTQQRIMLAAAKIDDLKVIENEKIHNDFEALSKEASNKPLNLLINLVDIFRDAITLFSLSIVISNIIWWLPFALLFPLFPVALSVAKSQKDIFKAFSEKTKPSRLIKYYLSVLLNPQLVKEVKLFNLSRFFMGKHKENFVELEKDLNQIRKTQLLRPQKWNLLYLISASVVMISFSGSIANGEFSTGQLLGVIQSITYFGITCQWGVYSLAYISVCFEFFKRLYNVEKISLDLADKGTENLPANQLIKFENVCFAYNNERNILNNVSFEIKAGEHIALVGENGAGKSTIIKLLCRLYTPTSGRITMGGVDINQIDIQQWRANLSAIFQDFGKYILTIEENIQLGAVDLKEINAVQQACVKAGFTLPNGIEFNDLLGKEYSGTELSGGQWQRLAIARALYSQQSQIVIMDEPTSALDPRIEASFFERFNQNLQDKTSIVVTHRLGTLKNVDKIIVLKNGEVVEQGSPAELVNQNGEYAELLNIQKAIWL